MALSNEYFNFIVLGIDVDWITNDKEKEFHKTRLFEYTSEEIEESFKIDEGFEKIKNLPCICTCEGYESPVFKATINTIELKNSNIKFSIKDVQEQPIKFIDLYKNNKNIIHNYELTRNHWAIKEGNLDSILEDTIIKTNNADKNFDKATDSGIIIANNFSEKIKGINDLISRLESNPSDAEENITFYRGHSNIKYKLEPSLFRKDVETGEYPYREIESTIYHELLSRHYSEFINDTLTIDKLVHMQHYSLPTRLLDITSNPLIALYFACKENDEEDGDFISITTHVENIKYFNSDTVSCLANLAKLSLKEKERIIDAINNNHELKTKFLNFIREEKPYFLDGIIAEDLNKILCVKSKVTNPRVAAQSGSFMIFGLINELEDNNTSGFKVNHYPIDKNSKSKILKELDLLNVNESTVFPYLENSARYIAKKFRKYNQSK